MRTNIAQLVVVVRPKKPSSHVLARALFLAIGSADTHLEVLESHKRISKLVLQKGLDASTAFEILSIDIARHQRGREYGARLEADKAESQKSVAQARLKKRRAMAVAVETGKQSCC